MHRRRILQCLVGHYRLALWTLFAGALVAGIQGFGQGIEPKAVQWLSPAMGAIFRQGQPVHLQIETEGMIRELHLVEFYSGTRRIGVATQPPFQFDWFEASPGFHWITAVARGSEDWMEASLPIRIAVTPADCDTLLVESGPPLAILSSGATEPEIFFAEDISRYPPFGLNQIPRPSIPRSQEMASRFRARLPGVHVEDFERFDPDTTPVDVRFGTSQVTLEGSQSVLEVSDIGGTIQGQFPISGLRGLSLQGDVGSGFLSLEFSESQVAFGFFGTDIELNGLAVTLYESNGIARSFDVPITRFQGSGGAFFWGVLDPAHPFVKVELTRIGLFEDGFLFDDLHIARPFELGSEPAWPELSAFPSSVDESDLGSTEQTLEVRLSRPSETPVTVQYSFEDLSAVHGMDYLASPGVVRFEPGETRKVIPWTLMGDPLVELDESFRVRLHHPIGALVTRCEASVIIRDDDVLAVNTPPRISSIRSMILWHGQKSDPLVFSIEDHETPADRLQLRTTSSDTRSIPESGMTWIGSGKNRSLVLSPTAEANGPVTIQLEVMDAGGLSARTSFQVDVVGLDDEVALISDQSEALDWMATALDQIGVGQVRVPRELASVALLHGFKAVVWNPAPDRPALNSELVLLEGLVREGVGLYAVGPQIAGTFGASEVALRERWADLLNVDATVPIALSGAINWTPELISHPVLSGIVGAIGSIVSSEVVLGGLPRNDAVVLGRQGAGALLVVSHQTFPRVVTQLFSLGSSAGQSGSRDHRRLFQNALWWILGKPLCPFPLALDVASGSEENGLSGDSIAYKILMRRTGDCSISGSMLKVTLDPSLEVAHVNSNVGRWERTLEGGILRIGSMQGDIREARLCLVLQRQGSGTVTNRFVAQTFLNLEAGEPDLEIVKTEFLQGSDSIGSPELIMERLNSGEIRLSLQGATRGVSYRIEGSADLSRWTDVEPNADAGWRRVVGAVAAEPQYFRVSRRLECP